jgi:hypothetical protein
VLGLLPREVLWDRLFVIRSAPGFGKTSLMNSLEAHAVRLVAERPERYREHASYLTELGVLDVNGDPQVLGFRIPLKRDFKGLLDLGTSEAVAQKLFLRLLDARVATAYVEAALMIQGLRFPSDAGQVNLRFDDVAVTDAAERIGGTSGAGLIEAAAGTERDIRDLLDSLLPIEMDDAVGHSKMYSLEVLGTAKLTVGEQEVSGLPLVMFDDGQDLAPVQRRLLLDQLRDRNLAHARWYAERYEALDDDEVLTNRGDAEGRSQTNLRLEEAARAGTPDLPTSASTNQRFERLLLHIADQRAEQLLSIYANEHRPFSELLTPPGQSELLLDPGQFAALRERVQEQGTSSRYEAWLELAQAEEPEDAAVRWRELEILVARDRSRTQGELFEQTLEEEDWTSRTSASVREAARLFLSDEFRVPYYFGTAVVARLGSNNIDQFINLGGDLFQEVLARITLNREDIRLPARRQHDIIVAASKQMWRSLPLRLERGRDLQRLLYAVGQVAYRETYRATAPYAPGVTGVSMSMDDFYRLADPERRQAVPGADQFVPVLATAIANNLLDVEFGRRVKHGLWMVMHLNRLLLPAFRLPLSRGGFRERPLAELVSWISDEAAPDPGNEQLELPLTLMELAI